MLRTMLKSKLHGATVTETHLQYAGSVTIDSDLMAASDVLDGERVQIVNLNNGSRTETYAMPGDPGSGVVCLNGPAARRAAPGDTVHILCYCQVDDAEARSLTPRILILGPDNTVAETK